MKTAARKASHSAAKKEPPYGLRTPREVILVFPGEKAGDPDEVVTIVDPSQIMGVYWGDQDLAGAKAVKSDGSHKNPFPASIKRSAKATAAARASKASTRTMMPGGAADDNDLLLPPACYWDGSQWVCC